MLGYAVSLAHPSTRLLYSTVRLTCLDIAGTDIGLGTGFFFEDFETAGRPAFLVTNKHVREDTACLRARFHTGEVLDRFNFCPQGEEWVDLPDSTTAWREHPNPDIDLMVLPVEDLKTAATGRLEALFFSPIRGVLIPKLTDEPRLSAIQEITMVGYPAGQWDAHNNLPILRRGTTASHPAIDFDGKPDILLDIAAFPGSSGSPVLILREGQQETFLGVLHSGPTDIAEGSIVFSRIPTVPSSPFVETQIGIHLGLALKSRLLLEFVRTL